MANDIRQALKADEIEAKLKAELTADRESIVLNVLDTTFDSLGTDFAEVSFFKSKAGKVKFEFFAKKSGADAVIKVFLDDVPMCRYQEDATTFAVTTLFKKSFFVEAGQHIFKICVECDSEVTLSQGKIFLEGYGLDNKFVPLCSVCKDCGIGDFKFLTRQKDGYRLFDENMSIFNSRIVLFDEMPSVVKVFYFNDNCYALFCIDAVWKIAKVPSLATQVIDTNDALVVATAFDCDFVAKNNSFGYVFFVVGVKVYYRKVIFAAGSVTVEDVNQLDNFLLTRPKKLWAFAYQNSIELIVYEPSRVVVFVVNNSYYAVGLLQVRSSKTIAARRPLSVCLVDDLVLVGDFVNGVFWQYKLDLTGVEDTAKCKVCFCEDACLYGDEQCLIFNDGEYLLLQ